VATDVNGITKEVIDGTATATVTIDDDDKLSDVVAKINALGRGVTASLLNDGTRQRLSLSVDKAGAVAFNRGAYARHLRQIDAGADDMQDEGDVFEIFSAPENFDAVNEALKTAGIEPQAAEVSMVPQNYIKLEGGDAKTMMKLYDALEDNDDVQKVYANFDIDESEME